MITTYGDNDSLEPGLIRHGMGEHDAHLWIGRYRLATPLDASDDALTADLMTAERLAAEASFYARDLKGLLEKRVAQREAEESAARAEHATGPQPAVYATAELPAQEAEDDGEPYGGDDPDLDARVQRIADMPETHRKTETEDDE